MQTLPPSPSRPAAQTSLAKTRVFGVGLIVLSFVLGYYFLVRPLLQAMQTGSLEYFYKAVLFPPALLYAGIALCVADLRDGTIRETGPDGKPRLTRKGKIFLGGLVVVMLLSVAGWYLLLHVLGFRETP